MSDRFDRFEEGVEVLQLFLTQDRSAFEGRGYQIDHALNNPKVPQDSSPICIGGSGLQRTIRQPRSLFIIGTAARRR